MAIGHRRKPQRLGTEQRRVLAMLAEAPRGYTRSALCVNGFASDTLTRLVRRGLVTIDPESAKAGGGSTDAARFRITDAGRREVQPRRRDLLPDGART
jgi:hypothetical protein